MEKFLRKHHSSITFRLVLTLLITRVSCVTNEYNYRRESLCNAEERIANSCFMTVSTRSRLDCFLTCSTKGACFELLIVSSSHACYHSKNCEFLPTCTTYDSGYAYFKKFSNVSVAETASTAYLSEIPETTILTTETPQTTETPETTTKLTSTTTSTTVASCNDVGASQYSNNMFATTLDLFQDGTVFFETKCRKFFDFMSDTYLQFDVMMSTGTYDLSSLTWDDYVNGFRLGPNDYWIGLENLYRYTNAGNFVVFITVEYESNDCSGTYSVFSEGFVVHSASDGYKYSLNSFSSLGNYIDEIDGFGCPSFDYHLDHDIFADYEGVKFSTADKDQDSQSNQNCAQNAGAGWWFKYCSSSITMNPMGRSYQTLSGYTDKHVHLLGLATSKSDVRDAVKYVYMSIGEEP